MTLKLPAGVTRARLRQLWYVPLLATAMALMLLRLLAMARLLDVPAFATYSGGLLVSSSFGMLACLGLQPLLQRELPVMIVHRRERAGALLSTQCALVAAACALAGVLLAGAGLSLAGLSPGLLAVGLLHGLAQQWFLVATVESRSRGEPLRFARQNLLRAVAVLAAGLAAAVLTASAGAVLVVEALLSLALAGALLRRQLAAAALGFAVACRLAVRRVRALAWRSAIALLAVSSLAFLMINADRWLAAEWLGTAAFAQYAFAWTLLMVAQSVQVVINSSLFPLLARRFASHGRGAAFRIAVRASLGVLAGGALVALPLAWALDAAIGRWFAPYAQARSLLPLFLAIAVLRVSDFWSSYLVIVGLEQRLLMLNVAVALVVGVVWWLAWVPAAAAVAASDIAALAALLAVASTAVGALAAWRARHDGDGAAPATPRGASA